MKYAIMVSVLLGTIVGCNHKEDAPLPQNALTISIEHCVDGQPILWDALNYSNAAGESYSISTLKYYISNIRLHYGGQPTQYLDTILYVDGKQHYSLKVNNVPDGVLDSISCLLGIDEEHNVHGEIPLTVENVAMEWPSLMGGGYHFLKLEGHWQNGNTGSGYAIHLGKTPNGVKAVARRSGGTESPGYNCRLVMNISEWFRGPVNFSFSENGVYTMGSDTLMSLIAENGKDVYSIE